MDGIEIVNVFDINEAKKSFLNLLQKFSDEGKSKDFLEWIHTTWPPDFDKEEETARVRREEADIILKDIAIDLRAKLPQESILPSEKLYIPSKGENSDCLPECTLHVDSFLYDEEAVDELAEHGLLARNYCRDCGSRNTEPLVFISHSAPRERLAYIFNALLPALDSLTVLDVGSRLGSTLFAAYLYTKSPKIIGVEMNKELCQLQLEIVKKYGFQERIQVVEEDVMNVPDLVHSADVVILHNVFEFFLPVPQQEAAWRFLRDSVKPGALLVTNPPLKTSFQLLQTGIDLDAWVTELPPHDPRAAALPIWQEAALEVNMYRVLAPT